MKVKKSSSLITLVAVYLLGCDSAFAEWKVSFISSLGTVTPDVKNTLESVLWAVEIVCIVLCWVFAIVASKKLADEDYLFGGITFLSSIISGIAPLVARAFLY